MIGDTGGHRRTPLLPSAFLRPLSQRPMRMVKVVAHGTNQLRASCRSVRREKPGVLQVLRPLRIQSGRWKRSMALVLAFLQPKSATTWANLPLPKIGRISTSLTRPPCRCLTIWAYTNAIVGDPKKGENSTGFRSYRSKSTPIYSASNVSTVPEPRMVVLGDAVNVGHR